MPIEAFIVRGEGPAGVLGIPRLTAKEAVEKAQELIEQGVKGVSIRAPSGRTYQLTEFDDLLSNGGETGSADPKAESAQGDEIGKSMLGTSTLASMIPPPPSRQLMADPFEVVALKVIVEFLVAAEATRSEKLEGLSAQAYINKIAELGTEAINDSDLSDDFKKRTANALRAVLGAVRFPKDSGTKPGH